MRTLNFCDLLGSLYLGGGFMLRTVKVCDAAVHVLSCSSWLADGQQRSNSSHWYHPGNKESCTTRGWPHGH